MCSTSIWTRYSGFSPSAKLVFEALKYEGELTQKEIAKETLLVGRTVRSALRQLEQMDAITSRPNFKDARQRVYAIKNKP